MKEVEAMPSIPMGVECEMWIPIVSDSDRQPHRPATWDWFEQRLISLGGSTGPEFKVALVFVDSRPVPGNYIGCKGLITRDENLKYSIALPHYKVDDLRALLEEALEMFDQRAIYLCVGGQVEFIIPPSDFGTSSNGGTQ